MKQYSLSKNLGIRLLVGIFLTLGTQSAWAYSSGQMKCFFEIYATTNWPNAEKTPAFEINIMQAYEASIESKWLGNKIRLQYVPGIVAARDVQVAVVTMTYAGADAGADVSLKPDGIYVFKIGRQDADLVGAFLNCQVHNLQP